MFIDLDKVMNSGQCFRMRKLSENSWRLITKNNYVDVVKNSESLEFLCQISEYQSLWKPYLDMERDYEVIGSNMVEANDFLSEAWKQGYGLRVLNQDPWETLISFIISQRNNIPRIISTVDALCETLGDTIYKDIKAFPSPQAILDADLSPFKLGYRDAYLKDAAEKIYTKEIKLEKLYDLPQEKVLEKLLKIKGVGIKVANCTALYSLRCSNVFPIDTWIKKVLDTKFSGVWDYEKFDGYNGIVQMYIFNYAINNKDKF